MARLSLPLSPSKAPATTCISTSTPALDKRKDSLDEADSYTELLMKSNMNYNERSNATAERPTLDPRATDVCSLHRAEYGPRKMPPPERHIRTPRKGSAQALVGMNDNAKRDIQGYIYGEYTAVEKVGHEWIEPTGTKDVFFLLPEEPDTDCLAEGVEGWINGEDAEVQEEVALDFVTSASLEEYINGEEDEDVSWTTSWDKQDCRMTDTETSAGTSVSHETESILPTIFVSAPGPSPNPETTRRSRGMRSHVTPSFAQIMAHSNSSVLSVPYNLDSDGDSSDDEEDIGAICRAIEVKLSTLPSARQYLLSNCTPMTPPDKYTIQPRRSPSLSPPDTIIDIPFPSPPRRTFGLRRHSGTVTLASLIARADESDLEPDDDHYSRFPSASPSPLSVSPSHNLARKPCYDPKFPGHSPCATHDQFSLGGYTYDAEEVLRMRFEVVHQASGNTGYYRAWHAKKAETGQHMVLGGSGLREVKNAWDAQWEYELSGTFEEDFDGQNVVLSEQPGTSDCCEELESLYNKNISAWIENGRCDHEHQTAHVRFEGSGDELDENAVPFPHRGRSSTEAANSHTRVHPAPSKSTLAGMSSINTMFSNRTSATSKTSYGSHHSEIRTSDDPATVVTPINNIDERHSPLGVRHRRVVSDISECVEWETNNPLEFTTVEQNPSEDEVEELVQPYLPRPVSEQGIQNLNEEGVWFSQPLHDAPLFRDDEDEAAGSIYDDSTTTNDEYFFSNSPSKRSRRTRWTENIKTRFGKMTKKVRSSVQATKRFGKTVCNFVPAALEGRHPFQRVRDVMKVG